MEKWTRCLSAGLALLFCVSTTTAFAAIQQSDFDLETGRQFVSLCGADPNDPLYNEARLVCYGFLEGASQFHDALTHGDVFDRYFCTDQDIQRAEAVDIIIEFINASPERGDYIPVELAIEAFATKFPCN